MPELIPRATPSARAALLAPLAALLLTAVAGALVFALLGRDPLEGLAVFFLEPLKSLRGWGELGVKATPLILCALGYVLCFRASVMQIGAEGMLTAGAIAGGGAALAFERAGIGGALALSAVLVAGMAGGMLWAALTALLRDRFNANETLVSLMLVYIAAQLLAWLVSGPWRDPAGFRFPQSQPFSAGLLLPLVLPGSRLHLGFLFALAAACACWFFLARSSAGFRLQVGGTAPAAARYAGYSARAALWGALLGAGALAGLAGAVEATGPVGQLMLSMSPGYGFAAIIVAYAGRLNALGTLFGAFAIALFYLGGELAQSRLGLPHALTGVFQGLLLFFLLGAEVLVRYRLQWRRA